MEVKVQVLNPYAQIPEYKTSGAAGFDLVAIEDTIITPGARAIIPTGLAFEIPEGNEMQIRPRSGVSAKTYLRISNSPGTIDSDFRGELKILVDNIMQEAIAERLDMPSIYIDGSMVEDNCQWMYNNGCIIIRKGDRVAQGVIQRVERVEFTVVAELESTERGSGGFGHTGTK